MQNCTWIATVFLQPKHGKALPSCTLLKVCASLAQPFSFFNYKELNSYLLKTKRYRPENWNNYNIFAMQLYHEYQLWPTGVVVSQLAELTWTAHLPPDLFAVKTNREQQAELQLTDVWWTARVRIAKCTHEQKQTTLAIHFLL